MCGILGLVAPLGDTVAIDRARILAMRDVMRPRGPDAAGLFERRNVAFAHRRLAIRDRQAGEQPWLSDDGDVVLIYNGEVYDDGELRSELAGRGHRLRTRCDTELVMAAYLEWGRDCLRRLRGMFAFGIYDFRDESLFLARDRFGIKPLFLTEVDGGVVFASSIPAILRHPRFDRRPNLAAVSHYLSTLRLTLGRETLFAGLHQLLPGESLHWTNGFAKIERYWDYPSDEDDSLDEVSAAERLEAGLHQAVALRLVSDVPVGMFLSGGVDSCTLAQIVHRLQPDGMLGLCGGAEHDVAGDFESARRCAAQSGFEFGEVLLSHDDYAHVWDDLVDAYGTPVSTPSDAVIHRLACEAKKSVGVVLGGEGADELLYGYAVQHYSGYDFDRSRLLAEAGPTSDVPAWTDAFRASLIDHYGRDRFASEVDHYFALNSLIPTAAKPALFQPRIWREADQDRSMLAYYGTVLAETPGSTTSRKYARLLHRVNLEALLARLDTATMLAGLEARVPYTDHRLVEAMFRVPEPLKIDVDPAATNPHLAAAELHRRGSLRSKRILRRVAARLMPADLAQRPKASFPTPVVTWLTGPWRDSVRTTLLSSPFAAELFRREVLVELCDHPDQAGMWLWPLLNLARWGDRQFLRAVPQEPHYGAEFSGSAGPPGVISPAGSAGAADRSSIIDCT